MRRLQLFEFEDQSWLPSLWRTMITDCLSIGMVKDRMYHQVVPLLLTMLRHMNTHEIVDLCSGSAGPWAYLHRLLEQAGWSVCVTLTDKFPVVQAWSAIANSAPSHVRFSSESIDARHVPNTLTGVRTMFTAFHHFKPADAQAILQDAVDQRQGIGIFEFTQRTMLNLVATPFVSTLTFLLQTPKMKPLTLSRILWTYFVPIVPLLDIWDGFASNMRTYTPQELRELVRSVANHESYQWEIGKLPVQGIPTKITYLVGYPKQA